MHIAAYFIIGSVFLIVGLLFFLKTKHRAAMEEVLAEYPEHSQVMTSKMANFFGMESAGMKQIRGNGILLLTQSQLYFRMLLPKREILIPLDSVTAVETPVSFLGKTKGRKLLKVEFRNSTGGADSAAWLVNDLDKWVAAIGHSADSEGKLNRS